MPTYFLEPDTDEKADGTEVPVGTGFDRLNDGTRQLTVPTTGTDYIDMAADGLFTRVGVATQTLAGGEVAVCARSWVYLSNPAGRGMSYGFRTGGFVLGAFSVPAGFTGWQPITFTGPITQAQIDAMNIQLVTSTGIGNSRLFSAYVELFTRTDVWAAGNAKFTANRNPNDGMSVAAGWMSADICTSVDLGAGRSLFLFGDTDWATAAEQQAPFGTNSNNAPAARRSFVRNTVGIASAYNVDSATFTYYTGAAVTSYFPETTYNGETVVRWAYRGIVRGSRLWVTGELVKTAGLTPVANFAAYCDNFSGTPDTWTWTYLPPTPYGVALVGTGNIGLVVPGDGFVYLWSVGPGALGRSLYRVTTTKFDSGDWRGGEWWTGNGWSRDKSGFFTPLTGAQIGRRKPRNNVWAFAITGGAGGNAPSGGTVHRRASDSKYQMTALMDAPLSGALPYEIHYSLTPGTAIAKFPAPTAKFTIPEGETFVYAAACHPQLTFTGAGAGDQVWSYCTNRIGDDNNIDTLSAPRFVKALAIT